MAFDSTANLLFSIGANADDATENITRFRGLLGKDLNAMEEEFKTWSEEVLGNLETVKGAMIAGAGVIAAGLTAVAAYSVEAKNHYIEYVEAVERGSKVTGFTVEQMSAMKFMAGEVDVGYESLVTGLTHFASTVLLANEGMTQSADVFKRLGISQKDMSAGEKDMLPLLEEVMDRFEGMKNGIDKTALARLAFSRGGADLIRFLNQGSEGMKRFTEEAEEMGQVLTNKDVMAMKEYKLAAEQMKAAQEALNTTISRASLPFFEALNLEWLVFFKTIKQGFTDLPSFMVAYEATMSSEFAKIDHMAQLIMAEGAGTAAPPDKKGNGGVKEATQDFEGLSIVLEQIRMRLAGTGDEVTKSVAEIQHLYFEADKAAAKFAEMRSSGELTAKAATRESAALAKLPAAVAAYAIAQLKEITDKRNAAILAAGDELQQKIDAQREDGWQKEQASWAAEIAKMRDQMQKKGTLTAENEALLEKLETDGSKKRNTDQLDSWLQELKGLEASLGQQLSARMVGEEKIKFQHELDLQRWSDLELQKSLKTANGLAERASLTALYAANRTALLEKEKADLRSLQNSQGWQGVLGAQFGALLKSDEAAWKQWSESANQALTMVQLRSVATSEILRQGFNSFGTAMGQNIAQAIVYSTSIGQAMQNALASALESLSAQSLVQAIFSTALGFQRLAQYDFAGASAAFESAAYFGLIGGVAAVAGRAVAPSQAGSTASTAAAGAPAGASGSSAPKASATQTAHVQIIIQGPVIGANGIDELASMLTDAVKSRDVKLIATQVKQSTRATV